MSKLKVIKTFEVNHIILMEQPLAGSKLYCAYLRVHTNKYSLIIEQLLPYIVIYFAVQNFKDLDEYAAERHPPASQAGT
jgi:hypothetical protein